MERQLEELGNPVVLSFIQPIFYSNPSLVFTDSSSLSVLSLRLPLLIS